MLIPKHHFLSLSRRCAASSSSYCQQQVKIIRSGPHHRPTNSTRLFLLRRTFASSTTSKSGSDHHSFFQQQLEELESERTSLFGEEEEDTKRQSDDLPLLAGANQTGQEQQHAFFEEQLTELNVQQQTTAAEEKMTQEEDWEDMQQEREALFQFSKEEKQAWGSQRQVLSSQLLQEIALAREEQANPKEVLQPPPSVPSIVETTTPHHSSFTHVSQDGTSVHMVDVGHKDVTIRTAQAQSRVLLPDEVLEAFASSSNGEELVGKKGPIFSTAKLAGIMAAKKTSDLIPLCHPLPLDQVKIDIRLQGNEVIIDCTCRVTHKTGVEMEALTGATVAALTVYDMVKAVSHQVQITDTRLISKTGGKRTVSNPPK